MFKTVRRRLWVSAFLVSSGASLLFAGSSTRREAPHEFINPALDGTPVIVERAADGRALAAWTYRSGRELDIAVSTRDTVGHWSQPIFIGSFDGADQKNPALALDQAGNAYLAFSASDSRRVFVSFLAAGATLWSNPTPVSPAGVTAAVPALLVVGDRLVVGFRTGGRTAMVQLALHNPASDRPFGVADGPDPVPNTGTPPPGEGPDTSFRPPPK